MKTTMTIEKQRELAELGAEHFDALVAYGSYMYKTGLTKGAIYALTGAAIGAAVSAAISIVVEIKKPIKNRKEKEI